MNKTIRQPKQERSNEKKNKIIEASYELFSEVGYYNTNTPEIAKRAGVSTGIVYSYFKDKRDILLYVLDIYIEKVSAPFNEIFSNIQMPINFNELVPKVIDSTIEVHKENSHLHNTLHALATSDDEVNAKFISLENHITKDISSILRDKGLLNFNLEEKVHISMNIIQSFAHEFIYDKHEYIDYQAMKNIIYEMIISLFKSK